MVKFLLFVVLGGAIGMLIKGTKPSSGSGSNNPNIGSRGQTPIGGSGSSGREVE